MSETETELRAVLMLGVQMREAQMNYFRTRTPKDLANSKAIEAKFDAACRRVSGKDGPGLFDGEKGKTP